jgi:hypothetical protein
MASTVATPPPRRLFPSPVRNGGSGHGVDDGVDDGVVPPSTPSGEDPNSSAASWRTLTPQPKTNAAAKSPFEALVFHRLVDYLQEEQLNQSFMSQQQRSQPAAATTAATADHHPNHLPPDVVREMDDSDSVTSTIDPHHDHHQREEEPTTTRRRSPTVLNVDHPSATSSVVVLTPRRKDYDDAVKKRNEDEEPELDASRDDCTEDAEMWQWGSMHHPQLAQFPDIGTYVGSVDLIHFSSSLLVKRSVASLPPPRPSTTNNSHSNKGNQHGKTESNDNGAVAAWSVMLGHKNNKNRRSGSSSSSSIRLIDLEAMGQFMSGRIHRGKRDVAFLHTMKQHQVF